jgi:anaerobic nitric oxide reductase transcription regulator
MGKFELAHEGTLFLDEVGELPLPVQAKLLRALQSGEIQRLGSDHTHHVDVRVIAATNRDLKEAVVAGRFRADLYHRLSVYPLQVPPLRERGDDVILLTGYFLERNQRQLGLRGVRLSRAAQQWLTTYHWPGNVRELEHTLSRAIIKALSEGGQRSALLELNVHHLGIEVPAAPSSGAVLSSITSSSGLATNSGDLADLQESLEQFRREVICERLQLHQGNISATARSLGMDRGNLHRLIKRLGLKQVF